MDLPWLLLAVEQLHCGEGTIGASEPQSTGANLIPEKSDWAEPRRVGLCQGLSILFFFAFATTRSPLLHWVCHFLCQRPQLREPVLVAQELDV